MAVLEKIGYIQNSPYFEEKYTLNVEISQCTGSDCID